MSCLRESWWAYDPFIICLQVLLRRNIQTKAGYMGWRLMRIWSHQGRVRSFGLCQPCVQAKVFQNLGAVWGRLVGVNAETSPEPPPSNHQNLSTKIQIAFSNTFIV